jgi:hypothetical protein
MTLEEMRRFSPLFARNVFDAISLDCLRRETENPGGPAPSAVLETIGLSGVNLLKVKEWLKNKKG